MFAMNKHVDSIGFDDENDGEREKCFKKSKKSGGFQTMGIGYNVLKGILKRGYKVPTPIQRKAIPIALDGQDIVAMARTGSGKTACFLIPMFEKLKEHSGMGIRALILSPTRELAIQTLKFIKELGKFTSLKSVLILGGDPMESQFSLIHSAPDIVVATPGRFLHICIEMNLKLQTVQYVVFDEADRLFEMGFSEQLTEIIQRLPETRQTLLFSATLPKVLIQFAKAGLSSPVLIRPEEREAGLLCILKHIVKPDAMSIIFAATKHHVEYLHLMLEHNGIANTFVYSDLDASARKINTAKFQARKVNVLIVTDVAARGIDIPQLDYVINYNFPAKPKLFIHRVGRCARAGRSGHAFSLVTTDELCYMLDLYLFLGRPVSIVTVDNENNISGDGHLGKIPQLLIEEELSEILQWNNIVSEASSFKKVSDNGYKNYVKSRPGASKDSVKRAKGIDIQQFSVHPLFKNISGHESERLNFVNKIKNYRPALTVFELGQSANSISSLSMRLFRKINEENITNFHRIREENKQPLSKEADERETTLESSNADDIKATFDEIVTHRKRKNTKSHVLMKHVKVDNDNFIPYQPKDQHTERGLAVDNLKGKTECTLEMTGDTVEMMRAQKQVEKRWDPSKRKYVLNNNKEKKIKSESGQWIPISYKTDRYERWQEKSKVRANAEANNDSDENESNNQFTPKSLRLDTHWGRHNMKVKENQYKPLTINTEHILKQRIIKEKRRQRNGRKPNNKKKNKIKKKSSKFNKF